MTHYRRVTPLLSLALLFAMGLPSSSVYGQNTIRTPDGLLIITAAMPETVRVNEAFTYVVKVTNASDDIVLHNIGIKQAAANGFKVESFSLAGAPAAPRVQPASEGQAAQRAAEVMMIAMLGPGESETITVNASVSEEGVLQSCLEIESYTPALCMTARVTKPELAITKVAPKLANRCNVIELVYTVRNDGSGDVGRFQIVDSLGEGLATIDGENTLSFDVDGLAAGDTRRFVARVYAQESGTFSSRAVARAENSDLRARSVETTTRVVASDLRAELDGPTRIYGNQLATFTATVTNAGSIAADDVRVDVLWPAAASMVDFGDVVLRQSEMVSDNRALTADPSQQPTAATARAASDNQVNQATDAEMPTSTDTFLVDRLEPGQSAVFTYAIRTNDLEVLPTRIVARYVCTVDVADATSTVTASAMAEAKVVRFPALQLIAIDNEDPVARDGLVTYIIRVWNEGNAPDSDVSITAMLPDELEFEDARGPTAFKADGNTVTFEPIATMEPGARATYQVVAKPTGTGSVTFSTELSSKMLDQPVVAEEPTRLIGASSN